MMSAESKQDLEARISKALREVQAEIAGAQELEETRLRCRHDALLYLSYGSRSSGMLRSRLCELGYDSESVADALRYAEEGGYLNDDELLLRMWQFESERRGDSVQHFLGRMRQRGFRESSLRLFRERYDTEAVNARCLAIFLKRRQAPLLRELRDAQREGRKAPGALDKLLRRCQARGFRYEQVLRLLRAAGLRC